MWLRRFLGLAFQLALLVSVSVRAAQADSLRFNIKGTFDTPSGVYPLASPAFELTFDIPSDPTPGELIFFPLGPVALYTTAIYTNNGITTPPLANTYLNFDSASNGGGIYIFLAPTDLLPLGLAFQFMRGDIPQLYSGAVGQPHFAPATINLDLALDRRANQGAGHALSNISNGVLTITTVPEPTILLLLSGPAILLVWRTRNGKFPQK